MTDGFETSLDTSRTTIGPYEIVTTIGRGATGVVYLAHKPGSVEEVAIKVLHSGAGDDAYDRFVREVRVAQQLTHRHIVRVVDTGDDDGVPFLVMERLRGRSLRELIRENPTGHDLVTGVDLVAQLLIGLHHAHEHALVHRDVKPANVFVTDDGLVKILDFGVAKLSDTTVTADGSLVGTLAYMAPEQLSAQTQVDGRADVFSAAVVLYELVTGHRPFDAESTAAMLARIVHEDPAPLDNLPELNAIVMRALSKDPAARFQSAQEFAYALWTFLLTPRVLPLGGPADVDIVRPEETLTAPSAATIVTAEAKKRAVVIYAAIAAGLVAVVAAGIATFVWSRGSDGGQQTSATTTAPPSTSAPPTPAIPVPPPTTADLVIDSTPPGASIVLDGRSIGQTPMKVSATVDQKLQLQRAGYEPAALTIDAAAIKAGQVSLALTALPRMRLRASGSYAFEVQSGGRVLSPEATSHDLTVPAGQTVRLVSRKYLLNHPVHMDRQRDERVPAAGRVRVAPPPADGRCTVFIDGSDHSFPPFTVELAAGPHTIEFRCAGGSRRHTETVTPGGFSTVR